MVNEELLEAPDGYVLARVKPREQIIIISPYEKTPDPTMEGVCISSRFHGIKAGDIMVFLESSSMRVTESVLRVAGDKVEMLKEVSS